MIRSVVNPPEGSTAIMEAYFTLIQDVARTIAYAAQRDDPKYGSDRATLQGAVEQLATAIANSLRIAI